MNTLVSLLTHRSFFVRAAISIIVGVAIFFGVWAASLAWLPEGFFLVLPRPSLNNCQQDLWQTLRAFLWNLVLTGGLTAFASLFAVNRFPMGYSVPWMMLAIYGGLLGTNSFYCPNPDGQGRIPGNDRLLADCRRSRQPVFLAATFLLQIAG